MTIDVDEYAEVEQELEKERVVCRWRNAPVEFSLQSAGNGTLPGLRRVHASTGAADEDSRGSTAVVAQRRESET